MLGVVEHDQRAPGRKRLQQLRHRVLHIVDVDLQPLRKPRDDRRHVGEVLQLDPQGGACEMVGRSGERTQCQTALADAAWAENRQQAAVGPRQQRECLRELGAPPDEVGVGVE